MNRVRHIYVHYYCLGGVNLIYVISDVHGKMNRLMRMLDEINFSKDDTLYILGDMVDRGPDPIGVIQFVMKSPNVHAIMGNHDEMMFQALKYGDETQKARWARNGCDTTLEGFNKLSEPEQKEVLNFLEELPYYRVIQDKYLLVHAGVDVEQFGVDMNNEEGDFHKAAMNQKRNLVWIRGDFFKNKGLEQKKIIFGHTPRPYIDKEFEVESEKPFKIWFDKKYEDKICIDTGNCYDEGRMACLRLEDMKEFYIN